MENIINRILEVDQEAEKRLIQAENKKKQMLADARMERQKLKEETLKKEQDKLGRAENAESFEAQAKISRIQQEQEDKIRRLEEIYERNHENWEREMMEQILSDTL